MHRSESANLLEVLFTPADFGALQRRPLQDALCVVFDVLRATSTAVTALANGAAAVIPVGEISEAIALRQQHPAYLLAGERDGLRITAKQTGGIEFDLGNSPREFTREKVAGHTVVTTTTNGTRALRASAHAGQVLAGSFLNLQATADYIRAQRPSRVFLVCSGTGEETAYEDILGAGALADLLWPHFSEDDVSDAARVSRQIFLAAGENLAGTLQHSRNARRLLAIPELHDDVSFCLQWDTCPIVAVLHKDGRITSAP
jgi:2-phosphosulfolactate phosphatase